MRRSTLTAGLLLVAAQLPAAGGADPPARPAVPAGPPLTDFRGEVTAVDAGSITVRGFEARLTCPVPLGVRSEPAGVRTTYQGDGLVAHLPGRSYPCARVVWTRAALTLTMADGSEVVLHRGAEPERRVPVDEVLAAGGFAPNLSPSETYRLSDVRVGDEVNVYGKVADGRVVCTSISIERRPGGRVPPAPGEDPGTADPYHERKNAHQDFEYHGIPLPEKYAGRAALQLALAKLQQADAAEAARDRLAPPPRLVQPKPLGR
ncbi:MAG: hypothetical protein K2X82_00155 [Gemmataceae bacterium]|nr:hypothetical protein [Gemmataceae bacterium]